MNLHWLANGGEGGAVLRGGGLTAAAAGAAMGSEESEDGLVDDTFSGLGGRVEMFCLHLKKWAQ